MALIEFRPTTVVPGEIVDVDVPQTDPVPELSSEYLCEVCGKALTYGGRGRKPRFCSEHKKNGRSNTSRRSSAKNDLLALQAADGVVNICQLVGIGCYGMKFNETGDAIFDGSDTLKNDLYQALQNNPRRAEQISKALSGSTDIALLIALGKFTGRVGAIAVTEAAERGYHVPFRFPGSAGISQDR